MKLLWRICESAAHYFGNHFGRENTSSAHLNDVVARAKIPNEGIIEASRIDESAGEDLGVY